jgi:hypothetical protein
MAGTRPAKSHDVMSHDVMSHDVMSHNVMSHNVMSHNVMSRKRVAIYSALKCERSGGRWPFLAGRSLPSDERM